MIRLSVVKKELGGMKLLWEYELPAGEQPSHYDYEGPIQVGSETVFFATNRFEYPSEIRAKDRSKRGRIVTLDAVDSKSGDGTRHDLAVASCLLPSQWTFVGNDNNLLLHCGPLLTVVPTPTVTAFPSTQPQAIKSAARPFLLHTNDSVIFADTKKSQLYALDLAAKKARWELDLKSVKRYVVGAPLPFGDGVSCYGRDALNFIDTVAGNITHSIQIPRSDKLYSPIAVEGDLLLGYTNWSVGGVVRYCPSNGKVVWRYSRRSSGPASYCQIQLIGSTVVWVKGETEIVGIDVTSGGERWTYAASPWLYTEISIFDDNLVFGTAGRDGFIQVLDGATGQAKWSKFLRNGCAYFAHYGNSLVVGDCDCFLRRLRLSDGNEIDRIELDGPVVGDVAVSGTLLYAVVGFSEGGTPARLICVDL